MNERYLLECDHCQHQIELETRHAGRMVTCSQCHTKVTAPTMREIRSLPSAVVQAPTESGKKREQKTIWTAGMKMTFVAGLFMLLAGSIVGGMQFYQASSLDTRIDPYVIERELEQRIDTLTPLETLGLWQQELTRLVPEKWVEPDNMKNRRRVLSMQRIGFISFGVAVLGVLTIAGSIVWSRRQ